MKVGDYVNGYLVEDVNLSSAMKYVEVDAGCYDGRYFIEEKDIKSIVTKEQFESMKYEVN